MLCCGDWCLVDCAPVTPPLIHIYASLVTSPLTPTATSLDLVLDLIRLSTFISTHIDHQEPDKHLDQCYYLGQMFNGFRIKALTKPLSPTSYAMTYARDTRLLNLDALLCGVKPTEYNRTWFTRVNIAVREYMNGPDYDALHDYEHCVHVLGIAHSLWMKERGAWEMDPLVIFTAALVHDIGDGKYLKSAVQDGALMTPEQQLERQHKIVHSFLTDLEWPRHIADAAAEIASSVSFSLERNDPTHVQGVLRRHPALRIVQDADRLDALGEMGIARGALYGGVNDKLRENT